MLDAVMATYEGENTFILDEATPFSHGQRVMIAAVAPRHIEHPKGMNLHQYSGSAGNLSGGMEFAKHERARNSAGMLAKYANPDLIPLEKAAWAEATEEKYGKKMR